MTKSSYGALALICILGGCSVKTEKATDTLAVDTTSTVTPPATTGEDVQQAPPSTSGKNAGAGDARHFVAHTGHDGDRVRHRTCAGGHDRRTGGAGHGWRDRTAARWLERLWLRGPDQGPAGPGDDGGE